MIAGDIAEIVQTSSAKKCALIGLQKSGARFALLREPLSWSSAGDVDIVVADVWGVEEKLISQGYIRVFECDANRKYIRYDWDAREWVHLDVFSKVIVGNIKAPAGFVEGLLSRSEVTENGIPCVHPVDEAILLIFHCGIVKGYFEFDYFERIRRCEMTLILASAGDYSFLPVSLAGVLQYIELLKSGVIDEQTAVRKIRDSFGFRKVAHPSIWRRVYERLIRLTEGNPAVVFLGPDGAGKSTLTTPLAQVKWPSVRRQFMGPARESEMRSVLKLPMRTLARLRESHSLYTPIGIISRGAWQIFCYADFWDRLIRHIYFWGSHGVVVFDRYACDMFFRKPTAWNELLFMRLFPRPRYVFLCAGEAQRIHQRKAELTISEIESTIALYRKKLDQYGVSYVVIDTTEFSPEENLAQVVHVLVENDWFRNDI